MAKHVWTIVNLETEEVVGTNDTDFVNDLVDDENLIIIHCEGSYFHGDRTDRDIPTIADDEEY